MLPIKQTPLLVFFNLLLLIIMFLLMRPALKFPYKVSLSHRRWTIFLMFVFVLFSFWGSDWFHYMESYQHLLDDSHHNMEDVYFWIAQNLSVGYLSFRLVIWGGGLVLFLYILRKLPIKQDIAILTFTSIWLIWYAYARASLAMVILYLGVVLLYSSKNNKWLSWTLGITIIYCSLFFHKSAGFGVLITIIVIFSQILKPKYFVIFLVIAIPFVFANIETFIAEFLSMEAEEEGLMSNVARGQYYFDVDKRNRGWGELFAIVLELAPYYLIAVQCAKMLMKSKYNKITNDIQFFIRFQLLGIFIASIFFFNLGFGDTTTLAMRFMRFLAIPSVIVLTYSFEYKYSPKLSKYAYWSGLISSLYSVSYIMYCSIND